ncbi:MAG TPA: ATP-grasp fold amidoligase family protein [Gemmatimonadaceae bacterium]|nr:ATP-grasp fold amidoligase family protein [Gemmatimonadaceae bacterium]
MQWRKLFDFNPAFPILCDKIAVREFISTQVGDEHLIPMLWAGAADDIPFDRVARPFVLKSTHASGHVITVRCDDVPDSAAIRARAKKWLATNYGVARDEPGYEPVPPCLMIEQLVTTADGASPDEVRFFVFDGRVAVINTVFVEDGKVRNGAFHTPDWTRLSWHLTRPVDRAFPKPIRLHDMIELAERLGRGLDHVRVDIYDCGEYFWIGELTVYSWSGHARFNPDEADLELGSYWQPRVPDWRAVMEAFRGRGFVPRQ